MNVKIRDLSVINFINKLFYVYHYNFYKILLFTIM